DQRAREVIGRDAVDLQQPIEELTLDLDRDRGIHGLRHLLAWPGFEQAGLTEEIAFGAVRQRQLLAVAGDLGDLDSSRCQEVNALGPIARQVDDLTGAKGPDLDVRKQRLQILDRNIGQDLTLAEQPY